MNNEYDVLRIIEELAKGPRFLCNQGALLARELITKRLNENGIENRLAFATKPKWSINHPPVVHFYTPENVTIEGIPLIYSEPTGEQGAEGVVLEDGKIKMLEAFDWDKFKLVADDGRIVAYLISSQFGAQVQPLPEHVEKIPFVALKGNDLKTLENWIGADKQVRAKVVNHTQLDGDCKLVSIITNEPEKKPYPLICAHYDTVPNSNGAHDNASGTAVALQLTQSQESIGPCRFAFFDGEEINKAGSSAFVNEETASGAIQNISFVLEIDSIGVDSEIALLCSKKIYRKTKMLGSLLEAEIDPNQTVSITSQSKIPFSDVWPFMQKGIPVIRMVSRGQMSKNLMHSDFDKSDIIDMQTVNSALRIASILVTHLR